MITVRSPEYGDEHRVGSVPVRPVLHRFVHQRGTHHGRHDLPRLGDVR
jgi:hypothetical protein